MLTFALPLLLALSGPPDQLFEDLRAAPNDEAAATIEEDIWAAWLDPDSDVVDIMMTRGIDALDTGQFELALEFFDRAILVAPDYAEAYHRRANVFVQQEKYGEAIQDLNQAIAHEPRHFGAWIGLGVVFELLGAKEQALEAYEAALEIHPKQPEARNAAARLRRETIGRGI